MAVTVPGVLEQVARRPFPHLTGIVTVHTVRRITPTMARITLKSPLETGGRLDEIPEERAHPTLLLWVPKHSDAEATRRKLDSLDDIVEFGPAARLRPTPEAVHPLMVKGAHGQLAHANCRCYPRRGRYTHDVLIEDPWTYLMIPVLNQVR